MIGPTDTPPVKTTNTAADVTARLLRQANERRKDPRSIWGVPWGFKGLDTHTGGIQREELAILMARPGVGKSAILAQMAITIARGFQDTGKVVRLVLCEMSAESFLNRVVCAEARVGLRKVREGHINEEQFRRYMKSADDIAKLPIEFLDNPVSLDNTYEWLAGGKGKAETGWFAVDYLQIHPLRVQGNDISAYSTTTALSAGFRKIARAIAPGLVLSQMSRKCESRDDRRPQLSDLRDSGAIEQDASLVLGLYRDDIYQKLADHERNDPKPAQLLILKQRNGPLATIPLTWFPLAMRYEDASLAEEDDE